MTTEIVEIMNLKTFLPCGEWTRRLIGMLDIPLLLPVRRSVSLTISLFISLKSEKIFPLLWRNSPYSKWKHCMNIKYDDDGGGYNDAWWW